MGHGEGGAGAHGRFALPFAWEQGDNEPLAKTRGFVRELLRDNREYMKHGPQFFDAFAKAQKPRATVVACSDSRVQNAAWDNTPENDNFTVRNIGNLLPTSRGSVEYGVEHLNTPVLLIVGHTGCGAVKAAMGDKTDLSPAIRAEVEAIVIPKELQGETADSAWTAAVVANVHAQVQLGLDAFAPLVHEGRLTIIGAVYDFRNDLGKGTGRVTIIDVNGNSEEARLNAFVTAVNGSDVPPTLPEKSGSAVSGKTETVPAQDTSIEAITKKIEKLTGQESNKPKKPSAPPK
jgi:carbonic anhydrase